MSGRGLHYDLAQHRLIARISEAWGDIEDLRALLERMQQASSVPDASEFQDVEDLLAALEGRLPEMEKVLEGSPRLDAEAARPVEELRRIVAAARREAKPLSLRQPPSSTDVVRMAALGICSRLDSGRATIVDLIGPYRVRERLRRLHVGRALLLAFAG